MTSFLALWQEIVSLQAENDELKRTIEKKDRLIERLAYSSVGKWESELRFQFHQTQSIKNDCY